MGAGPGREGVSPGRSHQSGVENVNLDSERGEGGHLGKVGRAEEDDEIRRSQNLRLRTG